MMNHANRSKVSRITKTTEAVLDALKLQGIEVSSGVAEAAIASVVANAVVPQKRKEEKRPGLWNALDDVLEVAEQLGLDVRARAWGKYSAGMTLNDTDIEVSCAGNTYWITVNDFFSTERAAKWCMPRDEVAGDRADRFLIAVLQVYADKGNAVGNLTGAVGLVLGIDALSSRGYTKDILLKRKIAKSAERV